MSRQLLRITVATVAFVFLVAGISVSQTWVSTNGPWRADVRDLTAGRVPGVTLLTLYLSDATSVYRSTNSAGSWNATTSPGGNPLAITCKPDDPTVVLVGVSNLLKRSTNSGGLWSNVVGPDPNLTPIRLATSPASSQRMFLGVEKIPSFSSLRRSLNSGSSWEPVSYFRDTVETDIQALAPHPTDPLRVWAGGTTPSTLSLQQTFVTSRKNGVFFSTNGGVSWDSAGSLRKNIVALAVGTDNGTTYIFAAATDPSPTLYRTTNNGAQWSTLAFSGGLVKDIRAVGFVVYVAAQNGFYRSFDYGVSWQSLSTGLYGQSTRVLQDQFDASIVYLGSSGSLFKSVDYGNDWQEAASGITPFALSAVARRGNTILASGSGFPVIKRYDGSSWTNASVSVAGFSGRSLDFKTLNGAVAFAAGQNDNKPALLRSTNSGASWALLRSNAYTGGRYNGVVVDPVDTNRIFAFGRIAADTNIIISANGGGTWSRALGFGTTFPRVSALVIDATNPSTYSTKLYAAVDTGTTTEKGVWKSTNGGVNWTKLTGTLVAGQPVRALAMNPKNPSALYASVDSGATFRLRKSTDGGATWTTLTGITGPFTRLIMNPSNPASSLDLFVIAGTAIYRTADGGASWIPYTGSPISPIYSLGADGGYPYALAASTAGGVFTLPLPSVSSDVVANWNMTSIPATLANYAAGAVYPTAVSPVYRYDQSLGYVAVSQLANGPGYWLKFGPAQTLTYPGEPVHTLTVPVATGWNIVGTIADPVPVCGIQYTPPGILVPPFYYYDNGYHATDTLTAGKGYWVKFSASGSMILPGGQCQQGGLGEELATYDRFTVEDAGGRTQDLYVRNGSLAASFENLEMPPAPPDAEFDVRFGTGDYLRSVHPDSGAVELDIAVEAPAYPVTLSWQVHPENGISYSFGGQELGRASHSGEDPGIGRTGQLSLGADGTIRLSGRAQHVTRAPALPRLFALRQNYPNPFNPATTIGFDLPEDSRVDLVVLDLLGRQVAVLIDGDRSAGRHNVTFDASGLASGVYFYRLQATALGGGHSVRDVRKLLLVR